MNEDAPSEFEIDVPLYIPAVILCSALGPFNTAERLPADVVAKVHVRVAHNADKAKLFVPSHRVIHVLNWHWVSEADFKLDSPHGNYGEFLNDVEAIQQEQLAVLLKLGVPSVHYEGLTNQNLDTYNERVKTLRKMKLGNSSTQKIVGEFVREDLLQLGSPGRCLMMSGGRMSNCHLSMTK